MKALPVKFYDKKIGKKVQAFEVYFDLCCDPENEVVECVFFSEDDYPCWCSKVAKMCSEPLFNVIFLEVKE